MATPQTKTVTESEREEREALARDLFVQMTTYALALDVLAWRVNGTPMACGAFLLADVFLAERARQREAKP